MKGDFNLATCLENPAVMRVPQGPMLLHADDELCLAPVDWLRETFIPKLQQRFEISFEIACEVGDSFTYLKRKHTGIPFSSRASWCKPPKCTFTRWQTFWV